mgnify:CR=1 FL=1
MVKINLLAEGKRPVIARRSKQPLVQLSSANAANIGLLGVIAGRHSAGEYQGWTSLASCSAISIRSRSCPFFHARSAYSRFRCAWR